MTAATKDAKNPFYNSKYATLNEVMGVLRDPLADNDLAVIQTLTRIWKQELSAW